MDCMTIYTLTGITKDFLINSRCFGFKSTFKEVEDALMEDKAGFNECLYHYFVIESFTDGFYAFSDDSETWYKYDDDTGKYTMIDKPKETFGIINWAMG